MQVVSALLDLSLSYHACLDVDTLLKTAAAKMGDALNAQAVLVWLRTEEQQLSCRGRWFTPGIRLRPEQAEQGLLLDVLGHPRGRRLTSAELKAQPLAHLSSTDRELIKTALYVSIPTSAGAVGVLEVLNKQTGEFTAEDVAFAEEAVRITGRALETRLSLERAQDSGLETIERLTALYDVSRSFNSVLEFDTLLPIVTDKICDIMRAEACNLWLVDGEAEEVYFAHQTGEDPTTEEEDRFPLGEGLIGFVAKQSQPRLVTSPDQEPLLTHRREKAPEFSFTSIICAPLLKEEEVLGVVEVVNKTDGTPFDEDDVFFFTNIAEQVAIALNNASLLQAERKVHELDALLAISKEITSTLDLDRVLSTVVHQAATVVPFDRCIIGLFDRNRFVLGAVSGEAGVPRTREMDELRSLLESVSKESEAVRADNYDEGWQMSTERLRDPLVAFLEGHEYNGFYGIPLVDEQGVVGVLALLSGDAEFLSENHLEVLSILASQTTVAIRNARLYQAVPLISVWQPLVEKKKQLMSVPYARWLELGWKLGLAVLLLILIPWKLRVDANATVVPAERRTVTAAAGGVIEQVLVREAAHVESHQLLAQLDDSEDRVALDQARTQLDLARRELAQAEAQRDLGAARRARLRTDMHQAEVDLYQKKVQNAQLRSPIDGIVVTPKVEEKVGRWLAPGDTFCEVVDQGRMALEMNVPETHISFVQPGAPVAIKLNTYPTDTFRGTVERVSAKTISAEAEQFFVVRAVFPNPGSKARTGMAGRAKITAAGGWFQSGWYPVGYVLLRSPASWVWRTAWSWLP